MHTRWKILISVIAVVIIIGATFLTGIITIPRATQLVINPSNPVVESGDSITFSAKLTSDSFILSGKTITWSASAGSFDKTTGDVVVYTAPIVEKDTSVTVSASFAGDRNYFGSSASITVIVTPKKAAPTTLIISPSNFNILSNGTVILNAVVTPSDAPSELITWQLEGPGMLLSTTGSTVIYRAPIVKENATVKITAEFPGTKEYLSSSAICVGTILPLTVGKKATFLEVSPSSFTIRPSETITLTATLKDEDKNIIAGKTITWRLEGPGSLSSTIGTSVTYNAPKEAEEITVTIVVVFSGDEEYLGSSAQVVGKVVHGIVVAEEYVLSLGDALLKKVTFEGPVNVGGVKVVKITAESLQATGFSLSHIGLISSNVEIERVEIYATSIKAYSQELKELDISGEKKITLGPYETLTLSNAEIHMVRMFAETGTLKEIKLLEEHIGGVEPYVPTIIQTSKAELSDGYALTGPITYGELQKAVHQFEVGRAKMLDFSIVRPIEYSLNRKDNTYTHISKWVARASEASLRDISCTLIYLHFNAYGAVEMTLTGEDSTELPYGYNRGTGGIITDGLIHVIYGKIDEVIVKDFTIEVLST